MIKKWMKSVLVFFICVISVPFLSNAQRYPFRNFTVADGLGSSSVNHIFQDSKGYWWFATQGGGVSRFNGKEFTTYTKKHGLVNNDVTYIAEDKNHHIWIATAAGVSEFNDINFKNYKAKQGLTDGVVYCIYADTQNTIWFATQDAGVRKLTNGKIDSITTHAGLPSNEVYTITKSNDGAMWFGLYGGIVKYQASKAEVLKEYSDKTFFCSLYHNNLVWFGSTNGDLVSVSPVNNTTQKISLPTVAASDFIGGLTADLHGNIWIALEHGLLKYNANILQLFTEKEGLSVNTVQTVLADYEGNIWAGTLNGGVNLLSTEAFTAYTEKDGLKNLNVTCVAQGTNNAAIYVGTDAGLYIFQPLAKEKFVKATSPILATANITSISTDGTNRLWLCTDGGILVAQAKGDNISLTKKLTQIGGQDIVSPLKVIHDKKGNTWIATYGSGVFCINGTKEVAYNKQNGFTSDNILTVYEDHQSNIWFGTQDAGVVNYDGKSFQRLNIPGLNNEAVWSIAESNDGSLFFGTGESGLCMYRQGNTQYITTSNGLSADFIPSLTWNEKQKCLWLAGEKGIDKLCFNNASSTPEIKSYKHETGFGVAAVNHHGIVVADEDNLWLCTVKGLWHYNRQFDFTRNTLPKLQLTNLQLFYGKEPLAPYYTQLDTGANLPVNLHLPYNKNHLTFSIRALTTAAASYIFQLSGQDNDWSSPTGNNEITYTNIAPGSYTFKAKAIVNGVAGEDEVLFAFTVSPPWWRTWWFYVLVSFASIAGFTLFVKTREKLLREQNLKLEHTVAERTQEIVEQKKVVEKALGEKEVLLKEIHHRVKNNLQTISSMLMLQSAGLKDEGAKRAITESQSRVRSIALVHQKLYQTDGLEKVELNGFVNDLAKQIQSLYRSADKKILVHINIPETYILIDKAIPLGLIINELLTNSYKYAFRESPEGTVQISLSESASFNVTENKTRRVELIYHDTGPGLPSTDALENPSTLGLRLIKILSQQIGASLHYSNVNGCNFALKFAINM
jgi:two-component sensor histidine kinase/ligand-binding sensor domain-containing protein